MNGESCRCPLFVLAVIAFFSTTIFVASSASSAVAYCNSQVYAKAEDVGSGQVGTTTKLTVMTKTFGDGGPCTGGGSVYVEGHVTCSSLWVIGYSNTCDSPTWYQLYGAIVSDGSSQASEPLPGHYCFRYPTVHVWSDQNRGYSGSCSYTGDIPDSVRCSVGRNY